MQNQSLERFHLSLQSGVAVKCDQIFNLPLLQIIQNGGSGEPAVKAKSDPGFCKCCTQTHNDSRKHPDCSTRAVCIDGTEDRD
jgi:hypothetical protein